jgi:hypothetical protein
MQEIENNVQVRILPVQLTNEEIKRMKLDPTLMYLHSLRTNSRLSEELHETMLTYSLDPNNTWIVRNYLEWVSDCEERQNRMVFFYKREAMVDRMIFISMTLGTLVLVFLLWSLVLK